MTTWTKADLVRMQAALDRVGCELTRLRHDTPDEIRDDVNASLRNNACVLVRNALRESVNKSARERGAAARIAQRLESEALPSTLVIPQVITHREVAQILAEERAAERAEIARREREAASKVAPPYRIDPERDRRRIAVNLADVVTHGRVEVHCADADAFGTDTKWADVDVLVSWRTWARPSAERRNATGGWDRCTSPNCTVRSPADASAVALLWAAACAEEPLPEVFDLRGTPEIHGAMIERWCDALATAIRKASLGLVIVVQDSAWVLARVLPDRIDR